jgi:hypothetical protein
MNEAQVSTVEKMRQVMAARQALEFRLAGLMRGATPR